MIRRAEKNRSRKFVCFLIAVMVMVAACLSISTVLAVEGTGAIHGTQRFYDIALGPQPPPAGKQFCRTVGRTDYQGAGAVRLNDAVQGFAAQAELTWEHGRVDEGPSGFFDNCDSQVPKASVDLTKAAISGVDGATSISCTWNSGTYTRGAGGVELNLPAGSSPTPAAGQPGTCTVTSSAEGATTTNTRLKASGISHTCQSGPPTNTPVSCFIDWAFTEIATVGPQPTVSNATPTAGPETGGTAIVIQGGNLYQAAAVFFGDQAVRKRPCNGPGSGESPCFTLDSNSQITAYSPAGKGEAPISVLTPNGRSTASTGSGAPKFVYQPPPPAAGGGPPPAAGGGSKPGGPTAPGQTSGGGGPGTGTGSGSGSVGPGTNVTKPAVLPKAQALGGAPGQSNAPPEAAPPPPPPTTTTPSAPTPPSGGASAPSFVTVPSATSVPAGVAVGEHSPDLAPQGAHNMVGRLMEGLPGASFVLAGLFLLIGCVITGRRVDWSAPAGEESAAPVTAQAIARV